MKAIVYTSQTGTTKRYAQMLSEKTGLPAFELKSVKGSELENGAPVIYLGWLMAGGIKGCKAAKKRFDLKAVCAVGMGAPGSQPEQGLQERNGLKGIPIFYLQGGFYKEKLGFIHRMMMNMMSATVGKKLGEKEKRTPEEDEMLDLMLNGGDRVSVENLSPVIDWLNNN